MSPVRRGPRPLTIQTPHHVQISQPAARRLHVALIEYARSLDRVLLRDSITCHGSLAFELSDNGAAGPVDAFIARREFAHIHPRFDGSLHMMLPTEIAHTSIAHGWAEAHPLRPPRREGLEVMVYAPTDVDEFKVIKLILDASYRFARGGA